VPRFFRQNQGVTGYENISQTAAGDYIIGTSNGYALLDIDKPQKLNYLIHMNRIQKKFQNRENVDVSLEQQGVFSFDENSLIVSFSIPSYSKYSEVTYQYELKGLYDDWSPWERDSEIALENLPFGDYTLNIRGKVGSTLTSNTITYKFKVEKPWYLSNLAVIIYVFLVSLIMFIINRLFVRYYKDQRNRLIEDNKKKMEISKMESSQEIMKLKNDQLKNELESKNRELATTAMSLINKNELLLGIKQDLMQLDDKANRDEVIKVINKNLSNNNDWEFFKEAFNNADKDFLNKIKKKHPELTANDLKFCAFLRLNLSSKEIAPLLNISVRSVEIKRYRLRKKMNLDHSENLIDYILEI
jgi:DNA-binding CsgD family transcriptional regulator